MPYRLNPVFWLKTESDRVEGIITMQKYWNTVWTSETLKTELEALGMAYTIQQVEEIGAELITRGVIELTA